MKEGSATNPLHAMLYRSSCSQFSIVTSAGGFSFNYSVDDVCDSLYQTFPLSCVCREGSVLIPTFTKKDLICQVSDMVDLMKW